MYEFKKHQGILLYEYLLETAKKLGISGGTAIKATAGFGHHGKLHEEQFWDIASNVPMEVKFFLSQEQSKEFFHFLEKEKISIFYSKFDAEYGTS
jgi:PII-like signaling protein